MKPRNRHRYPHHDLLLLAPVLLWSVATTRARDTRIASATSDASACSLCRPGEPVPRPDQRLDLTHPIPMATCRDLSNFVAILPDDSHFCHQSKAFRNRCGCPAPQSACTICPEGFQMTLPGRGLDERFATTSDPTMAGTYFGLNTTCELFESAISAYEETEQRCLDLPLDQLRELCACREQCHFCAGGEEPLEFSNTSFLVHGEDVFDYENSITSCREAAELAKETVEGSETCTTVQGAGTLCGCPVRPGACRLCPNGGAVGEHRTHPVLLPNGETISCDMLESRMHLVNDTSPQCLLMEPYAKDCGCTDNASTTNPVVTVVQSASCTLCPLGEKVPYPDRNLSGLDGLGFDFLQHQCGILEAFVAKTDLNSKFCRTVQVIGKMCGCSVQEQACNICGEGTMTNPLAEWTWAVGNAGTKVPDFLVSLTPNQLLTCEVADSSLSLWYDESNTFCYWARLNKGNACGCEGTSTTVLIQTMIWTQFCSGFLSLIGSLCIMSFILRRPKKSRWTMFHQIMFGISIFDCVSATAFILGTIPAPEDTGLYHASGNEATCNFQGWMFQVGQISMFYNVALSTYFLLSIKHSWKDRRFQKIGKCCHAGLLVVGLAMAFASIPFHESDYRWCYIPRPPISVSYIPGLVFFILPVGACLFVITVLTVLLVCHVHQVEKKTRQTSTRTNSNSWARRTFWQSLWYLAAFYLVWTVLISTYILKATPQNIWWKVVGAVIGPSQGFLNASIFFRNRQTGCTKAMLTWIFGGPRPACGTAASTDRVVARQRRHTTTDPSGSLVCASEALAPTAVARGVSDEKNNSRTKPCDDFTGEVIPMSTEEVIAYAKMVTDEDSDNELELVGIEKRKFMTEIENRLSLMFAGRKAHDVGLAVHVEEDYDDGKKPEHDFTEIAISSDEAIQYATMVFMEDDSDDEGESVKTAKQYFMSEIEHRLSLMFVDKGSFLQDQAWVGGESGRRQL